jgi:hypothetical protein
MDIVELLSKTLSHHVDMETLKKIGEQAGVDLSVEISKADHEFGVNLDIELSRDRMGDNKMIHMPETEHNPPTPFL